jgi:hypothetical protein
MSNNNNNNDFLNINNTFNNAKNTFFKMDTKAIIVLIAVGIIFIVFVAFMVYIYYQNFAQNKIQNYLEVELLDYMHDCDNNPLVIEPALIPASTLGNEYSLNFWIYVSDLKHFSKNPNHLGNVLMRGLSTRSGTDYYLDGNPGIYMETGKNNLVFCFKPDFGMINENENDDEFIRLKQVHEDAKEADDQARLDFEEADTKYENNKSANLGEKLQEAKNIYEGTVDTEGTIELRKKALKALDDYKKTIEDSYISSKKNIAVLNNIPLQRWTCINVSVFNQNVDLYIDGKLKTSKFLPKPPMPINTVPMILGPHGGFDGYLSRIKFSNKALNPSEIYQRYKEGPRITKSLKEGVTDFFSRDK